MSSPSPSQSSVLISCVSYDPAEVVVRGSDAARLFSPVASYEEGGVQYVTVRLTVKDLFVWRRSVFHSFLPRFHCSCMFVQCKLVHLQMVESAIYIAVGFHTFQPVIKCRSIFKGRGQFP